MDINKSLKNENLPFEREMKKVQKIPQNLGLLKIFCFL